MNFYREEQIYFAFIYKNCHFLNFKDLIGSQHIKHFNIKPFSITCNGIFLRMTSDAMNNFYVNGSEKLTYDYNLSSCCYYQDSVWLEEHLRKIDNELL